MNADANNASACYSLKWISQTHAKKSGVSSLKALDTIALNTLMARSASGASKSRSSPWNRSMTDVLRIDIDGRIWPITVTQPTAVLVLRA